MIATTEAKIDKDLASKKITVTKHYDAKPDVVWQAWTKQDILEKWWAPKPWRAESKKLDLREGGSWQYAMVGPENQRQNGKFTFTKINVPKSYEGIDSFTDERGVVDENLPQAHWTCEFRSAGAGTDVRITIKPKTEGALEKLLEMGFEDGFRAALGNLDEYLEKNEGEE
jgi:uncharacterized protein YndB with AHSA1/START domain